MYGPESFTILVTDQNHHIRNFLKRELEKEDYRVRCIETGDQVSALDMNKPPVDLIILDPDILLPYGSAVLHEFLIRHINIQIIIHAHTITQDIIEDLSNISVVEKNGSSIVALKNMIKHCHSKKAGHLE